MKQPRQSSRSNRSPSPSAPGSKKESLGGKVGLDGTLQLVQTHPLLVLSGAWVSVILIGCVALLSLFSPTSFTGSKISGAAIRTNPTARIQTNQQRDRIPLWLFGAIAITCTAGSILVSKQLTRSESLSSKQAKWARRAKRNRKRLSPHLAGQRSLLSAQHQPSASNSALVPQQAQSAVAIASVSLPETLPRSMPLSYTLAKSGAVLPHDTASVPQELPSLPPMVVPKPSLRSPAPPSPQTPPSSRAAVDVPETVVPADENHPLDWGEASLADTLDLRKRYSLSSWM